MKKKMISLALAFCLFVSYSSQSQTLSQQQFTSHLDSFTQKILERIPVIPAITITIVNENGAIFNKAFGWANKAAGVKADLNTEFYIASSTKSFTALAAALLDYEKKISLDQPIKSYFKNVRFTADLGDDVTVRSLLTHTSGLENSPLTFRMAYTGMIDRKDMLKVLAEATSVRAKPGKYGYDNLGYNIYGLAVQEYLQINWQDLLQEKIFKPLGMNHTTAYVSIAKKNGWLLAAPYSGYGPNGLEELYLKKEDNTMQSAGGLITTPSDIAIWLQAQITNGKIKGKQVFPEQVMKNVHTGFAPYDKGNGIFASNGQYGLGWSVSQYHDQQIIYHFGGFPGFRAHISFMPDKKTGLAIFVNEGNIGGMAADVLAGFVYDWVTGANVLELYSKKLDEMESAHKKATEGTQRSYADRAKRTSQLSLPLENYIGKYRHTYFGDMEVMNKNNVLEVRMGNLHAVSTAFTQKESIRVELLPGTGQVVFFKPDETGKVNSLTYDGQEYKRVNQ